MNRIPFLKMHGAGNDFIMFNGDDLPPAKVSRQAIADWCNRRTGIGADGMIFLVQTITPEADFQMIYFNADGLEAEMCGNGARCSVAFAKKLGWIQKDCRFITVAGILSGSILPDGEIEVSLPSWSDLVIDRPVVDSPFDQHHSCNTGVPHLVIPVEDVDEVEVERFGREFRFQPDFAPSGTNVNWVAPSGDVSTDGVPVYHIRTYERGVESETLACGTGASAAAVILSTLGLTESSVALRTRSGDLLRVTVDEKGKSLLLRGPAVESFQGEVSRNE